MPADIPDATDVLDGFLYVGSQESVGRDRGEILRDAGVTHVVTLMKRPPPSCLDLDDADVDADATSSSSSKAETKAKTKIARLIVKVEDTRAADLLSSHLDDVGAFIAAAKASAPSRARVLVHCAFGQSRSAAAVAAYLTKHEGHSLGEALERIRSRRPKACPNPSFLAQLVRYEMTHRGGTVSDLRAFPSLPKRWRYVTWRDPLRETVTLTSCHGRVVRAKRVSSHPRMFAISGFLTHDEAEEIIRVAAPALHPSLVVRHAAAAADADAAVTTGETSEGRTSWNARVASTHPAVRAAVQRACYLSNLTPAHAEPAQVVRYLPSQKYNSHCDWFDPAGATFEEKTRRGGQRVVTLLAYLREPMRGGRTTFPKLHLGFDPRVGDAVLWWNVDDDGKEDPRTLHAGEPVEAGEKFALDIWLRARPTRGEGGGGGGEEEEAAVEDDAAARAIEAST